jgi:hypothetical protein
MNSLRGCQTFQKVQNINKNYIISQHWRIQIKPHVLVLQQTCVKSFKSVQTGSLSVFSSYIMSVTYISCYRASRVKGGRSPGADHFARSSVNVTSLASRRPLSALPPTD